jgi:hypothetical protein
MSIYIETSVRNKCRCSFYCALLTLHVSAQARTLRVKNEIKMLYSIHTVTTFKFFVLQKPPEDGHQ